MGISVSGLIRKGLNTPQKQAEQLKYLFLLCFSSSFFILAFAFNTPKEIIEGSLLIIASPANLITDYFALANVGAALFNASLMAFLSIAMIWLCRTTVTGPLIAAVFTVTGFSLFGKNLYNSFPIILGVYLYCRVFKQNYRENLRVAIFGTALGPLVSEFSFNLNMNLLLGISLGILLGISTGFVLPMLAAYFQTFHQGYSLYNSGFTCGIIGTFFIGVLRSFGVNIETVSVVSTGNNKAFSVILFTLFFLFLMCGLSLSRFSFKDYRIITSHSGHMMPDFFELAGFGPTFINMSLLGFISTAYVLLMGGDLSGPVLGGILTVVGFGACGKHVKNVAPVLLGIYLVGIFNLEPISSPMALLAAMFGTTLAPFCGHYGPIAGVIAGALHMTMTMNISNLHAGMNLYNNGFSGGFVAAALIPIFNHLRTRFPNSLFAKYNI